MIGAEVAVWLYGSHARGDFDEKSDLDLLCISRSKNIEVDEFCEWNTGQFSFAHYSWDEILNMAQYSSLFLYHLKLEGLPLSEGESVAGKLASILDGLKEYTRVNRDFLAFKKTFNDITWSLHKGGSPYYELAILATVFRHASILGCFILGHPVFGRISPVKKFVDLSDLSPSISSEFNELYEYRLFLAKRTTQPQSDPVQMARIWSNRACVFFDKLEDSVNDYLGELSGNNSGSA